MQNPIPKLRQTSVVSKKPSFLSEKLKTLTSSNYHRVQYFFAEFLHVFYLVMSTKGRVGFFLILCRSWVINKNVKIECVETRSFLIFANNSRSKQNRKNTAHLFVDIDKKETFSKEKLNCRVVGARQSFQIFRQNTWFP